MADTLDNTKTVTQSLTFYNVTGFIEQDNRIYFAPTPKQMTEGVAVGTVKTMCQWYMDYFDSVIGIASEVYHNVEISRWSPSDRTLSARGTVDIFRKSGLSNTDKAFNYLVVKRTVTGEGTNYVYYMGFFITDVKQTGTNTVQLSLDVDNFTNAFYFMNTKSFSVAELNAYDIFNKTLVNCLVERQHYDRVRVVGNEPKVNNLELFLNPQESFPYRYQKKVSKTPLILQGSTRLIRQDEQIAKMQVSIGDEVMNVHDFESSFTHYGEELLFNPPAEDIDADAGVHLGYAETKNPLSYDADPQFLFNSGEVIIRERDKSTNEITNIFHNVTKIRVYAGEDPEEPDTRHCSIWHLHFNGEEFYDMIDLNDATHYYTIEFGTSSFPNPIYYDQNGEVTADWNLAYSTSYNTFIYAIMNCLTKITITESPVKSYNFTSAEWELVKSYNSDSWSGLPTGVRTKIIASAISFVIIKSKENIACCYGSINQQAQPSSPTGIYELWDGYKPNMVRGLLKDDIIDSLFTYAVPILLIPDYLSQYKEVLERTVCNIYLRSKYFTYDTQTQYGARWSSGWSDYKLAKSDYLKPVDPNIDYPLTRASAKGPTARIIQAIGISDFADVILSASIVKDLPIDTYSISSVGFEPSINMYSNIIELVHRDQTNIPHPFYTNVKILESIHLEKGLWFNILPSSRSRLNYDPEATGDFLALAERDRIDCISGDYRELFGKPYLYNPPHGETEDEPLIPCMSNTIIFQVSGFDTKEVTLNIEDRSIPNLKSNYYDPILENNPYTFYSLSYSEGVEVALNKQKYYNLFNDATNTYDIPFKYIYSNNDSQKIALVPLYSIDGFKTEYYNDSLVMTLSSQLPMVSDSYVSYYTQNLAQMKNQFAVNDYQRGSDLAQSFFNTEPAKVGSAFIKGGQPAGFSQLVKSGADMIDMGIDWAQSNNVIHMNQKAQLAGAGAKPDVVKQAGSDIAFDLFASETAFKLNCYRIDDVSYNSIAKGLERTGYLVNYYDTLHVYDRKGWNYIKLGRADFNHYGEHLNLTTEQESDIMDIFREGVTLLHNPQYLFDSTKHNYEVVIDTIVNT